MIELTAYDGYRIGDKISVMVSRIVGVVEMREGTSMLHLSTDYGAKEIWVLESREEVELFVNAYLETVHGA